MKVGISTVQFNLKASSHPYNSIQEVPYWQLYCSEYDKYSPGYKLPGVLTYEQIINIMNNLPSKRSFIAFPRKNLVPRHKYRYIEGHNILVVCDVLTDKHVIVMSTDKEIIYCDQQFPSRVIKYCKDRCYAWAKNKRNGGI